ncbi:mucoidy inhibitor MuiA family protein [Actinokineospora bangkokensis]|uniref:Aspartate ammonia-lyase n=1 Tax=Actinokineospora bangkokensis TaxID=1193682 RepID=A0A1Q9LTA2_9PSEU|nr:mucoidy inhibitor MuiA family protein [Actinokineospora bangkokensis]OLR95214.1 aspartate ammonia-lyase [Actinokineospora bangkokensis]
METRVDAPIVAVTVYPGQARVTRRGTAALAPGEQRVLVGGLPLGLHPDSVRVSGRGPATVLGVDVGQERHASTPDEAVAGLEERRDALRLRLQELTDQDQVLSGRADLLAALATRAGSSFAQALARGEAEPARVAEVGDALAGQLTAVLAERRALSETRQRAQAEFEEAQRRLADRGRVRAPDRRVVAVELGVSQAGEVELEVSYLVDAAGWESRYDVRLSGGALRLTWYGLVTQHSGEDWPECELRLSTARPAASIDVPELSPWFLDVERPLPPPAPMVRAMADSSFGAAAPMAAAPAGAAAKPVFEAVAQVEHAEASTTYRPTRPVAVPADGSSHRTTVAQVDLPAALDHVAVPLRGPEVYLRATAVNNSPHTLRPGRAALFHDSEFVGVTDLATWAPGEEVELTLGIDDRVRVERELTRRAAGKAVMGGTRRQEVSYRITVGNHGPRPARIAVVDQLPVSRTESAVVRDVVVQPQPAESTELGELTWRAELQPGQTWEITFSFRVDFAKGVAVRGLRD